MALWYSFRNLWTLDFNVMTLNIVVRIECKCQISNHCCYLLTYFVQTCYQSKAISEQTAYDMMLTILVNQCQWGKYCLYLLDPLKYNIPPTLPLFFGYTCYPFNSPHILLCTRYIVVHFLVVFACITIIIRASRFVK